MNYAQLISLFNQYLKDETATSFDAFLQTHTIDRTPNERLDVSGITTGNVSAGKNAKYQELLDYIAQHNVEIISYSAHRDLRRLYNAIIVKNAKLQLGKDTMNYVYYQGVKPEGEKRDGNYKLRKTGKKSYWLFSVGVKKILIPALITGGIVAAVLATAGALLPVGALGIVTDSLATNIISGAVLGFPIGAGLTAAAVAIKDAVTKRHYKKMIEKQGVNHLIEKIENTQKEIASKKGVFHKIGNYFRRNKNRNRLWALLKYREKASANFGNALDGEGKSTILDDVTNIDNFLRAHIENVYKEHLITNSSMEDLDIIGKYYRYDLANDSKELAKALEERGVKHPGRTNAKEVQSTVKSSLTKIVAEHLTGNISKEVEEKLIPENEINQVSDRKKAKQEKRAEADKREKAEEAMRQQRDKELAEQERKEEEQRRQAAEQRRQEKEKIQNQRKQEKLARKNANNENAQSGKAEQPKAVEQQKPAEKQNEKPVEKKVEEKPATTPAKKPVAVKPRTSKIPENVTNYKITKEPEIVDGDSLLKKKLLVRVKVTYEQPNEDGSTETKTSTKTLVVATGRKSVLKDLTNTPSELATAIEMRLGMILGKTKTSAGQVEQPKVNTQNKNEVDTQNNDEEVENGNTSKNRKKADDKKNNGQRFDDLLNALNR